MSTESEQSSIDFRQVSGLGPSGHEYPPPPRVHWAVLLLAVVALSSLFAWLAPRYQNILDSLLVDGWIFHICLWVRRLNPDSSSLFWCDLYAVVELSYAMTSLQQHPTPLMDVVSGGLGIASSILGIVNLYIVRDELLKHYNEREPIGIYLGPVLTFFFSYLYFQSQLYEIAQYKKRQAEGIPSQSGNSLF